MASAHIESSESAEDAKSGAWPTAVGEVAATALVHGGGRQM